MGELARRRRARDLWISRNHVVAAAIAAAMGMVGSFALGATLTSRPAAPAAQAPTLLGTASDESLVELLARVESAREVGGGLGKLTFPDALSGEGVALPLPEAEAELEALEAVVPPGELEAVPAADPLPEGTWTIEVDEAADLQRARQLRSLLHQADQPAWLAARLVEGRTVYRVGVGGYASEEAAESALGEVLPVLAGRGPNPHVEPIEAP